MALNIYITNKCIVFTNRQSLKMMLFIFLISKPVWFRKTVILSYSQKQTLLIEDVHKYMQIFTVAQNCQFFKEIFWIEVVKLWMLVSYEYHGFSNTYNWNLIDVNNNDFHVPQLCIKRKIIKIPFDFKVSTYENSLTVMWLCSPQSI